MGFAVACELRSRHAPIGLGSRHTIYLVGANSSLTREVVRHRPVKIPSSQRREWWPNDVRHCYAGYHLVLFLDHRPPRRDRAKVGLRSADSGLLMRRRRTCHPCPASIRQSAGVTNTRDLECVPYWQHWISKMDTSRRVWRTVNAVWNSLAELLDARYPPECTIRVILDNHFRSHIQAFLSKHPNRFQYDLTRSTVHG